MASTSSSAPSTIPSTTPTSTQQETQLATSPSSAQLPTPVPHSQIESPPTEATVPEKSTFSTPTKGDPVSRGQSPPATPAAPPSQTNTGPRGSVPLSPPPATPEINNVPPPTDSIAEWVRQQPPVYVGVLLAAAAVILLTLAYFLLRRIWRHLHGLLDSSSVSESEFSDIDSTADARVALSGHPKRALRTPVLGQHKAYRKIGSRTNRRDADPMLDGLQVTSSKDSIKAAPEPPRELTQGLILQCTGDFNSSNLLGEGYRGLVYAGTRGDRRQVAVKVMYVHSASQAARVERRVRLLVRLQHEHMLHVLGYCLTPTRHYVMFDFGGFRSLRRVLSTSNAPPSLQWRLSVCHAVAQAVAYLHWNPYGTLLHRCITTHSVFIHETSGAVRLADFAELSSHRSYSLGTLMAAVQRPARAPYTHRHHSSGDAIIARDPLSTLPAAHSVRHHIRTTSLPRSVGREESSVDDSGHGVRTPQYTIRSIETTTSARSSGGLASGYHTRRLWSAGSSEAEGLGTVQQQLAALEQSQSQAASIAPPMDATGGMLNMHQFRRQSSSVARGMVTPPEVFQSHQYTTAGDVYQFGMLMLECVAGEQLVGDGGEVVGGGMAMAATRALLTDHSRVLELLPANLQVAGKEVVQMQALGELMNACLTPAPGSRPSMVQVVRSLGHILGYGEGEETMADDAQQLDGIDRQTDVKGSTSRVGAAPSAEDLDLENPAGQQAEGGLRQREREDRGHVGDEGGPPQAQSGALTSRQLDRDDSEKLRETSVSPIELSLLLPAENKV